MRFYKISGQSSIEYLVIIAVIVVISLVVTGLLTNILGNSGSSVSISSGNLTSRIGANGISINDSVVDTSGNGVISLNNVSGDMFTVSKIVGAGASGNNLNTDYSNVVVPSGGASIFSLESLNSSCVCGATDQKKSCDFMITLTSSSGLTKTQKVTTTVTCVQNASAGNGANNPFGDSWVRGPADSTTSDDYTYSVVVDVSGNVYAAGYFNSNDLNFGGNVKLTNTSQGSYDFFVVKYDSGGNALWARSSAAATAGNKFASSVAVDGFGNVYVAGRFYSSDLNFGGSVKLTRVSVLNDFFVVKYDSGGNALWARGPVAATAGNGYAYSVVVDVSGNVYAAGYFNSNDLNFGGNVKLTNTSPGSYDFFVVKYDSGGNALWARSSVAATPGPKYAYSTIVDGSGNVYVAGYFYSSDLNFGGNVQLTRMSASNDFFVVKYDSGGNALWARGPAASTTTNGENAYSVAVDVSGNVYVAGTFNSTDLNFGGGVKLMNTSTVSSTDNFNYIDFFVVKYDSGGNVLWARGPAAATTIREYANFVAVDGSGNIYVAGYFSSSDLNFGGSVKLTNTSPASYDFFVVKYDSGGNALWARGPAATTTDTEVVSSVTIDGSGNVYAAGYYNSTNLNFGRTALTNTGPALKNDFFVVKYGYNR